MPIRITGMNSGLDTESIITELVKAKSTKKDSLVKAQTKLEWKQDAWKDLNSKVYALYSKTLSNLRLKSDYTKKTTKSSNASAVSVIAGANAVNGVQTVKVEQLAKTGYLTGEELKVNGKKASYKSTDIMEDLGAVVGSQIEVKVGDKATKITVDADMTVNDFVTQLRDAGLNASFDEKNQRFFISAKNTGKSSDFSLTGNGKLGIETLQALGISTAMELDDTTKAEYLKYCDSETNGNRTIYKMKDISQMVAERTSQFNANQEAVRNLRTEIEAIENQYQNNDISASIKELEEQLAQKKAALEQDPGNVDLEADITLLNEQIANAVTDEARVAELRKEGAKIVEVINEQIHLFAEQPDGSYIAKVEGEKNLLEEDTRAKAEEAVYVLNENYVSSGATRIKGEDAKIFVNGATFESESNTFEINGLTITAQAETQEEFTITTSDDTDGIYDMIKGFLKEYNELINEMDKLYNAESSKGYEPLTDEEKDAMNEKDIEKWEEKIKNALLRKDSTLNTVASAMKQIMLQGVKMSDGTQMYLSDFGINTLGYFTAKDNEKNAYHIDGDPDDTSTMSNADKLKTAIANDPEKVIEFFSSLTMSMYNKLGDLMKKTEYSSSFTLYDDVAMKDEYNDYKSKISKQEQKITDFEDRYYKKFSAMETALAKLSSKESAISGLLGM